MQRSFFDSRMERPELHAFAGGTAAVFSRRSEGKETPNEDAAALIQRGPDSGLLVVCDGAGGLPAGEKASRRIIECLQRSVGALEAEGLLRTAILDGVEKANARLLGEGLGSASTFVAAEIDGQVLRPYHVGDSQVLLTGLRGRMKLQTLSHSPMGFAMESGLMDESEAMHHEDRHLVSNLVGSSDMRIEMGPSIRMARYDTLLLASDGLFDNLFMEEAVALMRRGPLLRAASRIAEKVGERMSRPEVGAPSKADDLAFILYRRNS